MSTETKETALVTIEPTTALDVFTNAEKVDPILAAIRKIVAEFTPDVTTAKGRAEIASMAHKVARSKTYLDGIGKKLTDEYKEIPKKIDANRKKVRDELDRLKDEVRRPLTEWEEAEAARVQGIKDRIEAMREALARNGETSADIALEIRTVESVSIDESFAEFAGEAAQVKDSVVRKLRNDFEAAVNFEAEQAELQRLREEKAKREAEERDRRIAEAAAEKARKDAEEAAARAAAEAERKAKEEREAAERRELELKLAAEKAERERLEAIERAEREKQAAIDAERRKQEEAERARLAEEARIKAEEKRRAEDLAHRESIHKAILGALKDNGIPASHAASVVSLLSTSSIPFVIVEY
jgi:DNA repair exonuclease SbcCD ATPase subunit